MKKLFASLQQATPNPVDALCQELKSFGLETGFRIGIPVTKDGLPMPFEDYSTALVLPFVSLGARRLLVNPDEYSHLTAIANVIISRWQQLTANNKNEMQLMATMARLRKDFHMYNA